MRKNVLLVLVIACGLSVNLHAVTEAKTEKVESFKPGEEVEKPKSAEEAYRLREKYRESEKEVEKARERIKVAETKSEDKKAAETSTEKQQLTNDKALVKTFDQAGKFLQDSNVQNMVRTYEGQLASGFEPTQQAKAVETSLTKNLQTQLSAVEKAGFTQDKLQAFESEMDRWNQDLNSAIDMGKITKQLDDIGGAENKLAVLTKPRKRASYARDYIKREMETIESLSKTASPSEKVTLEKYKNALNKVNDMVTEKLEQLDTQAVAIDRGRLSFFTRAAKAFEDWFAKTFDFGKPTERKRSISDEVAAIKRNAPQVKPLARFIENVDRLESLASGLQKVIATTPEGALSPKTLEGLKNRAQKITDELSKLETELGKRTPAEQKALGDVSENLQKLTADLLAKAKRYPDTFSTLFEKEMAYYNSDSIFGGTRFKANQAYEALGLKPGATESQIEEAYAKSRNTLEEGSPEWMAARNASFLLRNRTSKATYDAFLRDYASLSQKGLDPNNITNVSRTILKNGEVSKLVISKKDFDAIINDAFPVLTEFMSSAGSYRAEIASETGMPPLFKRISAVKKGLNDAIQKAEKTSSSGFGGLPG